MLLGAMPEESVAGLLMPSAKSRATDFSIAAIMSRGAGPPEECERTTPTIAEGVPADGQFSKLIF